MGEYPLLKIVITIMPTQRFTSEKILRQYRGSNNLKAQTLLESTKATNTCCCIAPKTDALNDLTGCHSVWTPDDKNAYVSTFLGDGGSISIDYANYSAATFSSAPFSDEVANYFPGGLETFTDYNIGNFPSIVSSAATWKSDCTVLEAQQDVESLVRILSETPFTNAFGSGTIQEQIVESSTATKQRRFNGSGSNRNHRITMTAEHQLSRRDVTLMNGGITNTSNLGHVLFRITIAYEDTLRDSNYWGSAVTHNESMVYSENVYSENFWNNDTQNQTLDPPNTLVPGSMSVIRK